MDIKDIKITTDEEDIKFLANLCFIRMGSYDGIYHITKNSENGLLIQFYPDSKSQYFIFTPKGDDNNKQLLALLTKRNKKDIESEIIKFLFSLLIKHYSTSSDYQFDTVIDIMNKFYYDKGYSQSQYDTRKVLGINDEIDKIKRMIEPLFYK